MKSFILLCLSGVILLTFSSCAGSSVRPPSYTYGGKNAGKPDLERIQVDTKKPIAYVWNRWDEESKSRVLVNSGDVVSSRSIARILEASQYPEVLSKLNQYKTWSDVGTYSSIVLALGAVSTGIGYIRKSDGSPTLSISVINIFWGISAIAMGTTIFSLLKQDYYLNEAVESYNATTRPNSFAMTPQMGEKQALLHWGMVF